MDPTDQAGEAVDESQIEDTATSGQQAEGGASEQEQAHADGQAGEGAEQFEEIEYEGKKYQLPAELKDALLRQADYTRKTQEVAEMRKSLEAQSQLVQQHSQAEQAVQASLAEVHGINRQLAQFQSLDWNEIINQDPVQAMRLQQMQRQLEQQRATAIQRTEGLRQEATRKAQEQHLQALQRGHQQLAREIRGWGPELQQKLRDFAANELGYSGQRFAAITDPAEVKALYRAYLATATASTKPAAASAAAPAAAAAQDIKPVTKVAGAKTAPAAKDPDRMSTDEWLAWRNKQLRAKRA